MTRPALPVLLAVSLTALLACASGAGAAPDQPSIAIAPAAPEVQPGQTVQFTTNAGTPVTWAVVEAGGGTIDAGGLYTAPDSEGTFTVTAADATATTSTSVHVKRDASAPPQFGAGTTYAPSFIGGVTGGGAMPDWSTNVVAAACAGDGQTDDTACLQGAADAARDQGKPLVIPATSAFYRIDGPFTVYGSVGGVGGTPTIKQTNTTGTYPMQKMMIVASGATGWIYNLHLVGSFDGSNALTEHGHQIDLGTVNGVTVKDNLLENAMGDAVGTDSAAFDGGPSARNVVVDGNTMRNPYRCGVGLVYSAEGWTVTNNVIEKPVNFVSGIDIEPERGGVVEHVEIAYNRFVMDNRTPNPTRGADGMAVFGWHVPDPPTPTAGGDYYLHHNYGTFGTGFSGFGNGGWGYIYQASNVEGSTVPQ